MTRVYSIIPCFILLLGIVKSDVKQDVYNGLTDLTFQLLDELYNKAGNEGENLLFSPINIYNALALVNFASDGSAKQEISQVLGFPNEKEKLTEYHQHLSLALKSLENNTIQDANVSTAAGMFVQEKLKIKPEFLEVTNKFYGNAINQVDFKNGFSATQTVNDWIANKTKGHISKLFESAIDSSTSVMLVTTLHFQADWKKWFEEFNTQDKKFNTGKSQINVSTLQAVESVRYYKSPTLKYETIGVPYKKDKFIHYFVLPDSSQSVSELIKNLNKEELTTLIREAEGNITPVDMEIPKLDLKWSSSLVKSLETIGLKTFFTNPNLKNMLEVDSSVSDISHDTKIQLNEKGTEASAVTTIYVVGMSGVFYPNPPIKFSLNRPFLFFIYHPESSSTLFTGVVHNPLQNKGQ